MDIAAEVTMVAVTTVEAIVAEDGAVRQFPMVWDGHCLVLPLY